MAVVVQKLQYAQIPDLKIIGIGSDPVIYFVHAVQVVSILTGKDTRWTASNALHNFLRSQEGSKIQKGGDLLAAYETGFMDKMIYTHHYYRGPNPSYFLTMEGIEEVLKCLPNQEDVRLQFFALLEAYRAGSAFSPISAEPPTKRVKFSGLECGIYVLKFNDAGQPSFYVGKSNDIAQRLEQHAKGSGAACVSGRSFTRVPVVSKGSVNDLEAWERAEVLELMFQYGINAVRGWKYTLCSMPLEQKLSAFDDVCERFDLCRKCGRGSHFVNECHTVTTDRWTNGLELRSYYHQPAEGRLAAEHEGRLAAERRNAEAVRVLTGR